MEFLKALYGEKALTYAQLEELINAHNGNEANKEKQIKIANLGTGEYVGKGKFDSAELEKNAKIKELEEAQKLIAEFKKTEKGNEALQTKITEYENQVKTLQDENAKLKVESAVKVALLEAKAKDIDYMTFKLKEKGQVELDEQGKIKGWDNTIKELQTQYPEHFVGKQQNIIDENKLPGGNPNPSGYTRKDILKMSYGERAKLFEENPEAYNQAMKN